MERQDLIALLDDLQELAQRATDLIKEIRRGLQDHAVQETPLCIAPTKTPRGDPTLFQGQRTPTVV